MNTEYVRNLHSNYVRLLLEEKPEENRYQYCILSRGGIKGLLPCSLRYMDGKAFLYYDITSKQNLAQFYQRGSITREWLLDFMESLHNLQRELGRFLLREDNVIWDPQHVFQDLESNVFSFLYVPYYEGENQFIRLLGFLVEKVDYEDEGLVECIYQMYEQMERNGDLYLQEQIFQDVKVLEGSRRTTGKQSAENVAQESGVTPRTLEREVKWERLEAEGEDLTEREETQEKERRDRQPEDHMEEAAEPAGKRLFGIFESRKGKKSKEQEKRTQYREQLQRSLDGYAVAEDTNYEEEYGRTAFLAERPEKKELVHRLYYADGRKASDLDASSLLIGKFKGKVDLYLEDESVSRMHARILCEQGQYYLEDENSTNGTYCGKVRLAPYERKKLETGDELRIGNITLFYR